LENLAYQNPLTAGPAVYKARIMLDINPDDDLEGNSGKTSEEDEQKGIDSTLSTIHSLFKVYPNPNDGSMKLEYNLSQGQNAQLYIVDIMGRPINNYTLIDGNNVLVISEESLSNGVYFYKVIINGKEEVFNEKVLIIK
jgi:hypothetical protein